MTPLLKGRAARVLTPLLLAAAAAALWVRFHRDAGHRLSLEYDIDLGDLSAGNLRISGRAASDRPLKELFSMVPSSVAVHRGLKIRSASGDPVESFRFLKGIGASDFPYYAAPENERAVLEFEYEVGLGQLELTNAGAETGFVFGSANSQTVVFGGKYALIVPSDADRESPVTARLRGVRADFQALPPFQPDSDGGYRYSGKIGDLAETAVAVGRFANPEPGIFVERAVSPAQQEAALSFLSLLRDELSPDLLREKSLLLLGATEDGCDVFVPDRGSLLVLPSFPLTPRRAGKMAERIVAARLAARPELPDSAWFFRGLARRLGEDVKRLYAARSGLAVLGLDAYFENPSAKAYGLSVQELGSLDPERQPVTIETLTARSAAMLGDLTDGLSPALSSKELLTLALESSSSDKALRAALAKASSDFKNLEKSVQARVPLDQGPEPDDGSSWARRHEPPGSSGSALWLLFTSGLEGYLENCGCTINQSGGMDKQVAYAARFRKDHPNSAFLDLGRMLPMEERPRLSPEAAVQGEIFARLAARIGFDALAVASSEIYNLPELLEGKYMDRDRYLCLNATQDGKRLFAGSRLLSKTTPPLYLVSLFDPASASGRNPGVGDRFYSLQADLDLAELARLVGEAPAGSLVALFGHLSAPSAKRVLEEVPGIHVLLRDSDNRWEPLDGFPNLYQPSRYKGVVVLPATARSYGLNAARLDVGPDGVVDFQFHEIELDSSHRPDPQARAEIARLYEDAYRKSEGRRVKENVGRLYAGAESCEPCHESQYRQWKGTAHSKAYLTLVEKRRNLAPECLGCHVVGYSEASFSFEQLKAYGGVQCESCHGAGLEHIRTEGRASLKVDVPQEECAACHKPERSPNFPGQFSEKYEAVRH